MKRGTHEHDSDSFGKPTSGSLRGLNPPMIGAPSAIIVDGIVERESGATPPPPAVTLRTVAVVIGSMFVVGLLVAVLFLGPRPLPAGSHEGLWLEVGSRFELTSEPDEYREIETWYAQPGPDTVYLVDGTVVTASEFTEAFPPAGALRVSVTASTEGTIDRVNAATAYRRSR
ncbi:MAG: hypothetical protein ACYCXR_09500 [Coriobacteriia bacterium]